MTTAAELTAQRDTLLTQARAKVPSIQITGNPLTGDPAADTIALRTEIAELGEFIDRPTPGLHTDTYDEDADGPNVDPTNV
ncbi:hypothetical protein ACFQ6C_25790 [Streptomyces sp. NPDC056454]|uniref:hypothetical protein n=1 Tax=Streptomyces sp. NPDC056454 TaxID=3345823 RepID=UPI00368D3513